jgi:hypothetical protein
MAANSLPSARIGQNGCSRGLPSGRLVARNAIENHGPADLVNSPRCNAVMPGQSSRAVAAMSGALDSNSRQVATVVHIARYLLSRILIRFCIR